MARSSKRGRLRGDATSCCAKAFVVACSLAAVAAAAGAASPVPPKWLTARDLSEAGADAVVPDVAVDRSGNVVVVWARAVDSRWTVQVVERPAAGPWSAGHSLSLPADHVASPQVAIAGSTDVAVWERYDGKNLIVQASDRDAGTRTWSAPTSLSPAGRDADSSRVAVDALGDAVAVWASVTLAGWTVQSAYRPAGGKWQHAVALEPPQEGTAAPAVALDAAGNAVAGWASTAGSGWTVHAAYRSVSGTWSDPTVLSRPDASGSMDPQLAIEGSGDAVAVWSRSLGTGIVVEQATRNAANGAWSSPRQISPVGPDAVTPLIAVNKRGNAAVVWTSSDQGQLTVVASYRQPGKDWGPPTVLADAGSGPLAPQIALDDHGDAVAVWSYSTGSNSRVQAASLAAGSSPWSAPRSLSRPGGDALTPQVALDAAGDGAVVWARYDGQRFIIQGVGYDANGPELEKLALPARGVVGRRLTFSVSPKDVWAAVRTIRWSFGDGTVGTGRLTGHTYARPGRYAARVTAADSFGHVTSISRWVRISAG